MLVCILVICCFTGELMLELIDHKDVIRDLKFAPNGTMSLGNYLCRIIQIHVFEIRYLRINTNSFSI